MPTSWCSLSRAVACPWPSALAGVADECVCALRPPRLDGVGRWYADFSQTTDAEVRELLERATQGQPDPAPSR